MSRPGNARVLVIAYIGYTVTHTPTALANNLMDLIARGTSFHGVGNTSIAFDMVGGSVEISNTRAPHRPDMYWDMWKIYADHNICNRVNTEDIDEVWIYIDSQVEDPNYVWGWEVAANGPLYNTGDGVSSLYPPNCGKQMFTMGFVYDRDSDGGIEPWVHSAELVFKLPELSGLQSCDFPHPGSYGLHGDFWDQGCAAYGYSDISGFSVLPGSINGYVGVCGDAHNPPNRLASDAHPGPTEYIYWDPTTRLSRCTDWQWNTLTNTVPISCATWGCNMPGYLVWWMQNVPGLNNNLHGRDGSLRPNWWDFRLAP